MLLLSIAEDQAVVGDVEGVQDSTQGLRDRYRKVAGLGRLAVSQSKGGAAGASTATIDKALEQIEMITEGRSQGPRKAYALGLIAAAQAESGNVEGAEATRRLALDVAAAIPDQYRQIDVLISLAGDRVLTGDVTQSIRSLDQLLEGRGDYGRRLRDITLKGLAGDLARRKRFRDAAAVISSISSPLLATEASTNLAGGQFAAGDAAGLRATLDRLSRSADSTKDRTMRADIRSSLALIQAKVGQMPQARETLKALAEDIGHVNETMRRAMIESRAASVYGLGGDQPAAAYHLDRARGAAQAIAEPGPKAYALAGIGIATVAAGDIERAEAILAQLAQPYQEDRKRLAGVIAAAQALRGDIEGAKRTIGGVVQDPSRPLVIAELAERVAAEMVESGQRESVPRWAESLESPFAEARALYGMAHAILRTGGK